MLDWRSVTTLKESGAYLQYLALRAAERAPWRACCYSVVADGDAQVKVEEEEEEESASDLYCCVSYQRSHPSSSRR